jgi:uncharacterized membrane protein YbhN (UPF0104 family)
VRRDGHASWLPCVPILGDNQRGMRKSLSLLVIAGVLLWLAVHFGIVDTARISGAFRLHPELLLVTVACLLGISACTIARHAQALSVLVAVPWTRVAAANLVSQGIGQWAPGSLTVTELVRVGLLVGGEADRRAALAKIGLASLFDRLCALGVLLCTGSLAALGALGRSAPEQVIPLVVVATVALGGGSVLIATPLLGDSAPVRRLAAALANAPRGRALGMRLASLLDQLASAGKSFRHRPRVVALNVVLSACVAVLNALACYAASLALGKPISPLLLAAVLPLTVVGIILPLGFAGFGGPQLVTALLFAPFGIRAEAVVEATLLQNAVSLGVQTALALLAAAPFAAELSTMLRGARRSGP